MGNLFLLQHGKDFLFIDEELFIVGAMELSFYEFKDFVLNFSQSYLSSGGPVSRLERRMEKAGSLHGYELQLFATPSYLNLSIVNDSGDSKTYFLRIKDRGRNLSDLSTLDVLLDNFALQKQGLEESILHLDNFEKQRKLYSDSWYFTVNLLIGFIVAFPIASSFLAACISGIMTAVFFKLLSLMRNRFQFSVFFSEFFVCFLCFFVSAFISDYLEVPFISMSVGLMILLVPGLSVTTAISEWADRSILSGLIRMSRALLTLLSMGVAYLLVIDFVKLFQLKIDTLTRFEGVIFSGLASLLVFILSSFVLTFSFAIFFNAPKKYLKEILLISVLAASLQCLVMHLKLFVLGPFAVSFLVGLLSFYFSRKRRTPSQIFSTANILMLVPGMLAFSSFEIFSNSSAEFATKSILFLVFSQAGAIVMGLLASRVFVRKTTRFEEGEALV